MSVKYLVLEIGILKINGSPLQVILKEVANCNNLLGQIHVKKIVCQGHYHLVLIFKRVVVYLFSVGLVMVYILVRHFYLIAYHFELDALTCYQSPVFSVLGLQMFACCILSVVCFGCFPSNDKIMVVKSFCTFL